MKAVLLLFVVLACCSCSVNSWDVSRYQGKFERNKKDFEQLVRLLKSQNLKAGYPVNENELTGDIRDVLDDLDISEVNLDYTDCQGPVSYEFAVSWSLKATVYFKKMACSKEETRKGYHANITEMVEVWGLGDGWMMWIDHDFI